jgi:hypothetical protein
LISAKIGEPARCWKHQAGSNHRDERTVPMATCHLTADRLRELLDYNPETGAFTRRIRRGAQPSGALAGTVNGKGYRQVFIDGKIYL